MDALRRLTYSDEINFMMPSFDRFRNDMAFKHSDVVSSMYPKCNVPKMKHSAFVNKPNENMIFNKQIKRNNAMVDHSESNI